MYGAFFCCPTNSPFLLLRVVCFVLLLTCPHKVFLRLQELRLAICEPCSSECLCSFGSRSFIAGLGRLAKGPTRSNHAQFFQSVGTVCKVHCCFSPFFPKRQIPSRAGNENRELGGFTPLFDGCFWRCFVPVMPQIFVLFAFHFFPPTLPNLEQNNEWETILCEMKMKSHFKKANIPFDWNNTN